MRSLVLTLIGLTTLLTASVSFADGFGPEHGYRYHGPYGDWDRGFHTYYGYSETECTRNPGHYTCYSSNRFRDSDEVYIEELHMNNGYHRVRIYEDAGYTHPYVSYYVRDDGVYRGVEYREFENDYDDIIVRRWVTTTTTVHWDIWDQAKWDQGFEQYFIGSAVAIGGLLVAQGTDNTTVQVVALTASAIGSISASKGRAKMDASGLETVIIQEHYHQAVIVH